jgi:hypothetical protein
MSVSAAFRPGRQFRDRTTWHRPLHERRVQPGATTSAAAVSAPLWGSHALVWLLSGRREKYRPTGAWPSPTTTLGVNEGDYGRFLRSLEKTCLQGKARVRDWRKGALT